VPNCIAPPAVRSAGVAFPIWIFLARLAFVVVGLGTRHTLASYLSRQIVPATTASGAHLLTGNEGRPAHLPGRDVLDPPSHMARRPGVYVQVEDKGTLGGQLERRPGGATVRRGDCGVLRLRFMNATIRRQVVRDDRTEVRLR
jgi:hypothetical protein